ncbi:Sec-independent protein translocase subunit TatA [Actinomadura sp. BRA 177]|uniref:Sec-independent protein translocase subunit TatA n=1 Tax=Actinomadura sp. BRA 177 TaxID=2745202 RepID=UPI001595300F|nr:Sec-independent protein translocase subunit TatA [Actinomadura sp. BRA 177]NVI89248.1 Sec-independent protein translocase subunit TatA [Actinomadura sp. BRA 177]
MPNIGTPELLIILLVVVLIFGSAKLPQLARSLGKSARILKAETKGLREDDDDAPEDKPAQQAQAQQAQQTQQAQGEDPRERAARLREEAARLDREAAAGESGQRPRGAIGSGEPIQGVPVSDPGKLRQG